MKRWTWYDKLLTKFWSKEVERLKEELCDISWDNKVIREQNKRLDQEVTMVRAAVDWACVENKMENEITFTITKRNLVVNSNWRDIFRDAKLMENKAP